MLEARFVERHEDMSPEGTLKLIMEPDGDMIVVVKPDPDDSMQSVVMGCSVQFTFPGAGGGRSPRTRKALVALMDAMYEDNLEEESARGRHNDPPMSRI